MLKSDYYTCCACFLYSDLVHRALTGGVGLQQHCVWQAVPEGQGNRQGHSPVQPRYIHWNAELYTAMLALGSLLAAPLKLGWPAAVIQHPFRSKCPTAMSDMLFNEPTECMCQTIARLLCKRSRKYNAGFGIFVFGILQLQSLSVERWTSCPTPSYRKQR